MGSMFLQSPPKELEQKRSKAAEGTPSRNFSSNCVPVGMLLAFKTLLGTYYELPMNVHCHSLIQPSFL